VIEVRVRQQDGGELELLGSSTRSIGGTLLPGSMQTASRRRRASE
jgi:hypothetical protein